MSLLTQLPQIMEDSKKEYEKLRKVQYRKTLSTKETEAVSCGSLFHGDNLSLLADGVREGWLAGKIDLIYCDPPFFTKAAQGTRREIKSEKFPNIKSLKQVAYEDIWNRDIATYLKMLTVRLMFMRDALSDTGSIFMHLDWHAVHVVKLIMDEIFGEKNFINEIIWMYKSGGAAKRHFSKKHDSILFYSKTDRYKFYIQKEKSYNRDYKPYRFKGVEEFQDEIGWYTLVNQKDVWQIDMVGRSSGERVNYATQKPLALIDTIIDSVTDSGDLCADFFCGSGTLGACAATKGRRFICADNGELAIASTMKRFMKEQIPFEVYECKLLSEGDSQQTTLGIEPTAMPKISPKVKSDNSYDEMADGVSATSPFSVKVAFSDTGVSLISYDADPAKMPLKSGQSDLLIPLLKEDSLAFVDYWCSGVILPDKTFIAERIFTRDKNGRLVTDYLFEDQQLELMSDSLELEGSKDIFEVTDYIPLSTSEGELREKQLCQGVLVSDIFGRNVIIYDKI